ncbi:MAG TPA: Gfo/Idh/MocA family oxidoreductase [Baekduia sp.]|nr:Gfo/Idh/MocA family oxidoreductase [Baekduia sp.]
MPAPEPLRVALVGYGLAGTVFHVPLIAATDGLALRAIVTRDARRREQAVAAHPDARVVDALDEVLGEVDLVVVASANVAHVAQARAALHAGRHVVVDKPLAVTTAEARALAEQAAAAGLVLAPFHNRRWDDDFLTLRRAVDEQRLGRVLRLESRFDRWRPQVKEGAWREQADPAAGGGLLLDLGTHLADQAVQLLGPVTAIYAELDRRRPGAAVEDDVFVALRHAGGARSHLWAGVHAAHQAPRLRVLGERGTFTSEGLDPQEAALRAGGSPADGGFGRRRPEAPPALIHDGERAEAVAWEPGRWSAFYAGVVAAIRDGAAPPVTAAEAVGVLEILEAARRSAEEGAVISWS